MGVRGVSPFNGWRPVPPSLFIQNHYAKSGTFGFLKRTPEVLTNLSWEVRFFVGNGEGIEALAKPIFARGTSPFYGSGPAVPFNGSGPAVPFNGSGPAASFNGSGTAARPPPSTAGRTYSRPARLAAILRLLLLFLNTERNVSRSFILEGGALPRWKFFCCIFIFGGYFCG